MNGDLYMGIAIGIGVGWTNAVVLDISAGFNIIIMLSIAFAVQFSRASMESGYNAQ